MSNEIGFTTKMLYTRCEGETIVLIYDDIVSPCITKPGAVQFRNCLPADRELLLNFTRCWDQRRSIGDVSAKYSHNDKTFTVVATHAQNSSVCARFEEQTVKRTMKRYGQIMALKNICPEVATFGIYRCRFYDTVHVKIVNDMNLSFSINLSESVQFE